MKKRIMNLLRWLVALMALISIACSPVSSATAETATAEKLVVTDMAGRQIEMEAPASRVVALMPGDAEILFAIGAGDSLVGRGLYVDYPAEELEVIPAFSTDEDLNLEALMALEPDLVIMTAMTLEESQLAKIEQAGITVFISDAQTLEDVYLTIDQLGRLVGHDQEAADLIEEMRDTFADYEAKADQQEAPGKVYYEISPLEYGLWTAGQGTFMDEIGKLLGLENIFADTQGWSQVSQEQVLALNPDFIVTTSDPVAESDPTVVEEILGRSGWQDISAVKSYQVYQADASSFTRPGPRLIEAVKGLYEFVYGDEAPN